MSVLGVILVRILPHSDWIQGDTPNTDKVIHSVIFFELNAILAKIEQRTLFLGAWKTQKDKKVKYTIQTIKK